MNFIMIKKNHYDKACSPELGEELVLNISRLNNIQSEPLTEEYGITRSADYQDALAYIEDEIDAIENELDTLDDPFLENFFSNGIDE